MSGRKVSRVATVCVRARRPVPVMTERGRAASKTDTESRHTPTEVVG